MARPSRTGGKKSEAKARNASPAKGRKTTKTKPRIAPAATRVKRRSVSDPSKDLKEAREQQAATAEILKVIASSPSDVQPVFDAIAASANRLIGGFSAAVHRVCRRHRCIWRRSRRSVRHADERSKPASVPAPGIADALCHLGGATFEIGPRGRPETSLRRRARAGAGARLSQHAVRRR